MNNVLILDRLGSQEFRHSNTNYGIYEKGLPAGMLKHLDFYALKLENNRGFYIYKNRYDGKVGYVKELAPHIKKEIKKAWSLDF